MNLVRLSSRLVLSLSIAASAASAQVGNNQSGVLDPNVATEQQLVALPGMNAAIAKSVIDQRPFLSMLQLDSLLGKSLSKEQRTALYPKLFIAINLNTASRDEIILVPGVGARMAHEFEEYRPWKTWAQFDKEIGKYVGKDETARLAQYCFIPLDANKATEEDLSTIPNVSKAIAEQISKGRPWKSVDDLKKDLAKSTNEKEAARIARYLEIS